MQQYTYSCSTVYITLWHWHWRYKSYSKKGRVSCSGSQLLIISWHLNRPINLTLTLL